MKKAMEQLREFHRACDDTMPDRPNREVRRECRDLRIRLMKEEFQEYLDAEEADDFVEIADALADIIYVAVGAAVRYGIPLDMVFNEVHRSNMTKFGDGYKLREDGKILKPPTYEPPRVKEIIEGPCVICGVIDDRKGNCSRCSDCGPPEWPLYVESLRETAYEGPDDPGCLLSDAMGGTDDDSRCLSHSPLYPAVRCVDYRGHGSRHMGIVDDDSRVWWGPPDAETMKEDK